MLQCCMMMVLHRKPCQAATTSCKETTCGSLTIPYPFHLSNDSCAASSLQGLLADQFRLECENQSTDLYFPVKPNYKLRVLDFRFGNAPAITLDARLNGSCNIPNLHSFDLTYTHPLFSLARHDYFQLFNCASKPISFPDQSCEPNCEPNCPNLPDCRALGHSYYCNAWPNSISNYKNLSAFQACSTFISWRANVTNKAHVTIQLPVKYAFELVWGLPGPCSVKNYCAENADCLPVPTKPGLIYCLCKDGFQGDGYKQGIGCTPDQHGCTKLLCGKRVYGITGAAAFLGLIIIVALSSYLAFFFAKEHRNVLKKELAALFQAPMEFSYNDLLVSTKYFEIELGRGGFGIVYKGMLSNGDEVAVKVLDSTNAANNEGQFQNEVATIGNIHHLNLVRLVGFCYHKTTKILVYEYVVNGSLEDYLFSNGSNGLDWKQRYNIALGTAKGLTYLHEECRQCIIHCDIKPQNILLDAQLNPKISDFGLALLMERSVSNANAASARGTPGYTAPELKQGHITTKCDVYSFGMVLLEMIGGRENLDLTVKSSQLYFPDLGMDQARKKDYLKLVDPQIVYTADVEEVRRAVQVAFCCIQDDPTLRPTMSRVVKCLEGTIKWSSA